MGLLLRNGHVFAPEYMGEADIRIENGVIDCIRPGIVVSAFACAREIDASGLFVTPGFIDAHAYLTASMQAQAFLRRGTTGCLGVSGCEGRKATPDALFKKAEELNQQGLETLFLSGCRRMPLVSFCRTAAKDMEDIGACRGAGEIALLDSRAMGIPLEELVLLLQTVHKAVKKTGKSLKAVFNIGDRAESLDVLFRMARVYEHTAQIAIPTHVNRNAQVLDDAMEYIRMGGMVEVAAGLPPSGTETAGFLPAPECLCAVMDRSGSLDNVILSGPVPAAGGESAADSGNASPAALAQDLRTAYHLGLKIPELIKTVTSNPAQAYGFAQGRIREGGPACLNIVDNGFDLRMTVAGDAVYP